MPPKVSCSSPPSNWMAAVSGKVGSSTRVAYGRSWPANRSSADFLKPLVSRGKTMSLGIWVTSESWLKIAGKWMLTSQNCSKWSPSSRTVRPCLHLRIIPTTSLHSVSFLLAARRQPLLALEIRSILRFAGFVTCLEALPQQPFKASDFGWSPKRNMGQNKPKSIN